MGKPPGRKPDKLIRSRKYLTEDEVHRIRTAALKLGRHGHRDATMILMAFRHGLRVSELVLLRWDQVDLEQWIFHVRRLKEGRPSTHPLWREDVTALKRLKRNRQSPFVFESERGGPLSRWTFGDIIARAGVKAGLEFTIYPHMLRHACGYHLANEGRDTRSIQGYLGHRNIQSTEHYTALSSKRFNDFFHD